MEINNFETYNGNKYILQEKFNIKALKYIIKHFDDIEWTRQENNEDSQKWCDIMKILVKRYEEKSQNGLIKIFYKQNNNYGRYYAKNGMQSMFREIRHTISNEYYIDLDFKNCHPTLLLQYIKKLNNQHISYKILENYVNNRDDIIKNIMIKDNILKDKAKSKITSILFGSNCKSNIEWWSKFKTEIQNISKYICEINPDIVKKSKKQYNIQGSTVSLILQNIENECLINLCNFLQINGLKIGVLIFDGCQVEISSKITNDLLQKASDYIQNKTGYKLDIIIKPMNEGLKLNYSSEDEIDYDGYENIKLEFEKTHALVISPPIFLHIIDNNIQLLTQQQLLILYRSKKFFINDNGINKELNFINKWLNDDTKKKYNKIDFIPYGLPNNENIYNVFNGFIIENLFKENIIASTDMSIILNHISILCNHDEVTIKYLINWIAQIFQQPSKKTGTYILFKSIEGAGKNIFIEFIGNKLLGNNLYTNTSSPQTKLFNKHANIRVNKLLVGIDEVKGLHAYDDEFKDMITNHKMQIEPKGINAYEINCFCRFILTTNNDNPLKVSNSERRSVCIECSNEKANNNEYFIELVKWMDKKENQLGFYNFLINRDITQVNWIKDRPTTNFYNELKIRSTPPIESFLIYQYENRLKCNENFLCNEFIEKYRIWASNNRKPVDLSSTLLGLEFKKLGIEKVRLRINERCYSYNINWNNVKKLLQTKIGYNIDEL